MIYILQEMGQMAAKIAVHKLHNLCPKKPIFWYNDVSSVMQEGCLSLEGVRPCTRYQEIEVDYLDQNFKRQHGKYSGWTAQIIQHEIDHCDGIVI